MAITPRKSSTKKNPVATVADAITDVVTAPLAAAETIASAVVPSRSGGSGLFDLGQVDHGLSFPEFDPNTHFARDLFSDSSPLPRTRKEDADAMVLSIEEKRQSLRVAQSNIGLNQDAIATGVAYQKLIGTAIDFGTAKVNNDTKFIGYQNAGVTRDIARTKLQQTQEKLIQEEIVLNGIVELTPLIREEWEQRKALKQSRIEDLKQNVYLASSKLDNEIRGLASAAV